MGFSEQQAQNAVRQFDTLQQAVDSLLAGLVSENPMLGDVYLSDEDEQSTPPTVPAMQPYQQQQPASSRVTAPVTSATKVAPPPLASFKAALSQPSALAPTKTVASLQPAPAAAAKVQNSHKKNEPLPPIPQSHYEQAARQMQMSRAPCPPALVDDKKNGSK
jgi:hypothetical protein